MKAATVVGALGLTLAVFGGVGTAQASTQTHVDKQPARTMITKLHQHPLQIRVRVMGGYAHAATFLQRKECGTATGTRSRTRPPTPRPGAVRARRTVVRQLVLPGGDARAAAVPRVVQPGDPHLPRLTPSLDVGTQ